MINLNELEFKFKGMVGKGTLGAKRVNSLLITMWPSGSKIGRTGTA